MGLAPGLLPGRVSLEAGRDRFTAAWGSVPAGVGLSTADILASMAGERDGDAGAAVRALSSCWAPTRSTTSPTAPSPRRRSRRATSWSRSRGTRPSRSTRTPTWCLPCAVTHERPGTTTNLEGRVSRLGPKLTAPGFAWPDWVIAAELAAALGADLGVASVGDLADELAATAPAYAGLTQEVLHSDAAHDGILVPLTGDLEHRDDVEPIDPIALPGVESVERQGAPPRVGTGAGAPAAVHSPAPGSPPPLLSRADLGRAQRRCRSPRPTTTRCACWRAGRLYDAGSSVTGSPSLTPLVPALVARANPYDLDRLGARTGDRVKVRSARGELILAAEADEGVPRGVVAMDFNVPGGESAPPNAVATLIDSRELVTDVRLESV